MAATLLEMNQNDLTNRVKQAARSVGFLGPVRMTPAIVEDLLRMLTRRGRRYVPIVGAPGGHAMVTALTEVPLSVAIADAPVPPPPLSVTTGGLV